MLDFTGYPHYLQFLRESRAAYVALYKEWNADMEMVTERVPALKDDPGFIAGDAAINEITLKTLDHAADLLPGGPPTQDELRLGGVMSRAKTLLDDGSVERGDWAGLRESLLIDDDSLDADYVTHAIAKFRAGLVVGSMTEADASLDAIETFLSEQ